MWNTSSTSCPNHLSGLTSSLAVLLFSSSSSNVHAEVATKRQKVPDLRSSSSSSCSTAYREGERGCPGLTHAAAVCLWQPQTFPVLVCLHSLRLLLLLFCPVITRVHIRKPHLWSDGLDPLFSRRNLIMKWMNEPKRYKTIRENFLLLLSPHPACTHVSQRKN